MAFPLGKVARYGINIYHSSGFRYNGTIMDLLAWKLRPRFTPVLSTPSNNPSLNGGKNCLSSTQPLLLEALETQDCSFLPISAYAYNLKNKQFIFSISCLFLFKI